MIIESLPLIGTISQIFSKTPPSLLYTSLRAGIDIYLVLKTFNLSWLKYLFIGDIVVTIIEIVFPLIILDEFSKIFNSAKLGDPFERKKMAGQHTLEQRPPTFGGINTKDKVAKSSLYLSNALMHTDDKISF